MNTRQLEYVITVVNEGSISAAANKLLISQPSLSQYIKKLEDEIGIELFERSTPLVLTTAGEAYLKMAKDILQCENELKKKIEDIKGSNKGILKVGTGFFNSVMVMPQILLEYRKKFPDVYVELYEDVEINYFNANYNKDLDIIISSVKTDNEDYNKELVLEDRYILATPKGLIKKAKKTTGKKIGKINFKELDDIPFVVLGKDTFIQKTTDQLYNEAGTNPKVVMQCANGMVAYRMAKQGIGACLVPYTTYNSDYSEKIDYFEIENLKTKREVSVYYKKNKYLTRIVREFIKEIKNYYKVIG